MHDRSHQIIGPLYNLIISGQPTHRSGNAKLNHVTVNLEIRPKLYSPALTTGEVSESSTYLKQS